LLRIFCSIYSTGNGDDGHSISLTGGGPFKISKKWDTQNTLVLSYNRYSTISNNGPLVNDQLFFMFQSNHTIQLPLDTRMELNLLYRGPAASGLYHMASMHPVDIAFKKSFLKKNMDLSINGNDLLKVTCLNGAPILMETSMTSINTSASAALVSL
jgi:hypothetical protein